MDEHLRLNAKLQESFDYYISALEVGIADPLKLLKSSYTTMWHRLFIVEDLYQGFFLVRTAINLVQWSAFVLTFQWNV